MIQTEQILRQHAARYPKMEPTDGVKLLYQNEFGGGHMIRDEEACMDYLRREYAKVSPDPSMALYESIGNDMVRVNLAALPENKVDALGKAFIASAAQIQGRQERFLEKLSVLCKLTEEGIFAFSAADLTDYLGEYAAAGYPAVSHSPTYRQHYHPAYRVIFKKYLSDL